MKKRRWLSILLAVCLIVAPVFSNVGTIIVQADTIFITENESELVEQALDELLSLDREETTVETLHNCLEKVLTYIKEDRRNDYDFQDCIQHLEDTEEGELYKQFMLDWFYTWRIDPDYQNEEEDWRNESGNPVDSRMELVMRGISGIYSRYTQIQANGTKVGEFLSLLEQVLPKGEQDGTYDFTVNISKAMLDSINEKLAGVIEIWGGQEFIDEWNTNRPDCEGYTYPVSKIEDGVIPEGEGLDADSIKTCICEIVGRQYFMNEYEEPRDNLFYDWNYMHSVLEKQSGEWSYKEIDDVAHMIAETLGNGMKNYQKPFIVYRDIEDETIPEPDRHSEMRFTSFEEAVNTVRDSLSAYNIDIYKAEPLTLTSEMFEQAAYKHLSICMNQIADNEEFLYEGKELAVNGDIYIHGGSFVCTSETGVSLVTSLDNGAILNLDTAQGSGDITYDKKKITLYMRQENWTGEIENGDGEILEQGVAQINSLIDGDLSSSSEVLAKTLAILDTLSQTEECRFDFSYGNVATEEIATKLWSVEEKEDGPAVTIADASEVPPEVAEAIQAELEKACIPNEEGIYQGFFEFYLNRYKNHEEVSKQEKKDLLHNFLYMLAQSTLKGMHAAVYMEDFQELAQSDDVTAFSSKLEEILQNMATDSVNGNELLFYWTFEGNGENDQLWSIHEEQEEEFSPRKQFVEIHMDQFPVEGIYELFMNAIHGGDDSWRFQDFIENNVTTKNIYYTLENLIWSVRDFAVASMDAEKMYTAVNQYTDILLSVYHEHVEGQFDLEDHEAAVFSTENLNDLKECLDVFRESGMLKDQIRYYQEELNLEIVLPDSFQADSVGIYNFSLADMLFSTEEWCQRDRDLLRKQVNTVSDCRNKASIIMNSLLEAVLKESYPYQAFGYVDANGNGYCDEMEMGKNFYSTSWQDLVTQMNQENAVITYDVNLYRTGETIITAMPSVYQKLRLCSCYLGREGYMTYKGTSMKLYRQGIELLSPFIFEKECTLSSKDQNTELMVTNTYGEGNVLLDGVILNCLEEEWHGTYKDKPVTTTVTKVKGTLKTVTTTMIEKDKETGTVIKTVTAVCTDSKTKTSTKTVTVQTTFISGNTTVTIEKVYKNSKGTITKTINVERSTDAISGLKVEIRKEKNQKGAVVSASANISPGVTATVSGKKLNVNLTMNVDKIMKEAQKLKNGVKMDVTITFSNEKIAPVLSKKVITQISSVFQIPKKLTESAYVNLKAINLDKSVLSSAKKEGSRLVAAVCKEGNSAIRYSWTFEANALKKAKTLKTINLRVDVKKAAVSQKTSSGKVLSKIRGKYYATYKKLINNGFVCSFADNGILSCEASIKMYVGSYAKAGKYYRMYHANKNTGKLNAMAFPSVKKSGNYMTVNVIHCSDYIFTTLNLPETVAVPLVKQITGIPANKTLKVKKSYTIKPVLPVTLHKVTKLAKKKGAIMDVVITYKSSNSSIVSVGKTSGVLKAKKKGKCTIITTIKLGNGQKRTIKTKVTVK